MRTIEHNFVAGDEVYVVLKENNTYSMFHGTIVKTYLTEYLNPINEYVTIVKQYVLLDSGKVVTVEEEYIAETVLEAEQIIYNKISNA